MHYLIGCDIGTTNVKAVAFDFTGKVLFSRIRGYPIFHTHPDWSEQDPVLIYNTTRQCIQEVIDVCGYPSLAGISFSSAMHSLMAVDEQNTPLSPLIIWADNRSAAIAAALRDSTEGRELYHRNGTPIHAMAPVCKLLWIREQQPACFWAARRFIGIKEYIVARLTGKYRIDYSIASATGLFNIRERRWDPWTLDLLRIDKEQLSAPVSPVHLEYVTETSESGIRAGTPLIMGASDGCLANLGSGATSPGTMAVTIGTSAATRVCSPTAFTDERMRTFCYLLDEQTYVIGGATNNGAVVFQWLKDTFFPEYDYEALFKMAESIPSGADGLLFFPYLLGERAPLWNSAVRGGFSGLDIQHTRPHIVKSVMEGILLNLFSIGKILMNTQPVEAIYANGGFAQNASWVQMLADVFGKTVHLNQTVETGAAGAAMMGLKALGYWKDFTAASQFASVSHSVAPQSAARKFYAGLSEKFDQRVQTVDRWE